MYTIDNNQRAALADICQRHRVVKLELFGSATGANFEPECSDVDLIVEFEPETDLGPWMKTFFDLREELEQVFGRRADLIENSAIRNPHLRAAAETSRALLYAA